MLKYVVIKRFAPRLKRQKSVIWREFARERSNLLAIPRHHRILPFLGSYKIEDDKDSGSPGHWNLIFPYAEGGDLRTFLREESMPRWLVEASEFINKSATQVVCYEIVGLVEALAFIHNKGNRVFVIHRDIKPSNILIEGNTFKFADFGLSRISKERRHRRQTGCQTHRFTGLLSERHMMYPVDQEISGPLAVCSWSLLC
jgi:serine/threonine protein kinase